MYTSAPVFWNQTYIPHSQTQTPVNAVYRATTLTTTTKPNEIMNLHRILIHSLLFAVYIFYPGLHCFQRRCCAIFFFLSVEISLFFYIEFRNGAFYLCVYLSCNPNNCLQCGFRFDRFCVWFSDVILTTTNT